MEVTSAPDSASSDWARSIAKVRKPSKLSLCDRCDRPVIRPAGGHQPPSELALKQTNGRVVPSLAMPGGYGRMLRITARGRDSKEA